MVIKFLPQFVQRVLNNRSKKENLSRLSHNNQLRVAVDADALLYHVYLQRVDFSYGGENEKLFIAIATYLENLVKCHIEPTVFISGVDEEPSTEIERGQARVDGTYGICEDILFAPTKPIKPTRGFRFHPCTRSVLIEAVRSVTGVKFQVCPGSCFPHVVSFATAMKCPVIGYDSTYLVTDIQTYIHCDSLSFSHKDDTFSAQASVVRLGKFAEHIKMTIPQIRAASRFLPSDIIPPTTLQLWRDSLPEGKIVAELVQSTETEKDLIALKVVDSVFTFVRNEFTKGATEQDIINTVIDAQYKLLEENRKSEDESAIQTKDDIRAVLMRADEAFILRDHRNVMPSFADSAKLNPSPENTEKVAKIPSWIAMFTKQGKIPTWVYTLCVRNFVAFPVAMEEIRSNFPGSNSGSALPARGLRMILYGLLGLTAPVKEQLRRGANWVEEEVMPLTPDELEARGLPRSLEGITSVPSEQRRKYILTAIVGNDSELVESLLTEFNKNDSDMFATACLAYMFSRYSPNRFKGMTADDWVPQSSPEFAAGMINSIVLPQTATQIAKLIKEDQLCRDLGVMHMGAIWQYILDAALAINGVFGFCFEAHIEKLFSGPSLLVSCANEQESRTKSSSITRKYSRVISKLDTEIVVPQKIIDYNNGITKTEDGFNINVTKNELMFAQLAPSLDRIRRIIKCAIKSNPSVCISYTLLADGTYTSRDEDAIRKQEAIEAFNMTKQSKFHLLEETD